MARVLGVPVSGRLAWYVWAFTYLVKMVGFRKQLEVMIDHVKGLFFEPDISQSYDAGEVLRPRERETRWVRGDEATPDSEVHRER